MPSKDQPEVETEVDVVDADDLDINEASPDAEEVVDNEPKPGDVEPVSPFGAIATPSTLDTGDYEIDDHDEDANPIDHDDEEDEDDDK